MGNIKNKIEYFSFFDHAGISRHLEKMAAKGWMIEKIGMLFWTYRRIEPQRLHFAVSYYPKANAMDPEPSREQQTFWDFCAYSGWELACSNGQMQIFYNERENPIPIQTEPKYELEAIHNSAKRQFIWVRILLMATELYRLIDRFGNIREDFVWSLAKPGLLPIRLVSLAIILICGGELIIYWLWYWKAKKTAENGAFAGSLSMRPFQTICGILLVAVAALPLLDYFLSGVPHMSVFMLWATVFAVVLFLIMRGIAGVMRSMKATVKENMIVTTLVTFVLCMILLPIMVISFDKWYDQKPAEHTGYPQTAFIYEEEIPLQVGDLIELHDSKYDSYKKSSESLWLAAYYARDNRNTSTEGPQDHRIAYSVYVIKQPCVYNICKEWMLEQMEYREADAALWGAREAYRQLDETGAEKSSFLLFYEDRMMLIHLGWEPTAEQMVTICEKLNPVAEK